METKLIYSVEASLRSAFTHCHFGQSWLTLALLPVKIVSMVIPVLLEVDGHSRDQVHEPSNALELRLAPRLSHVFFIIIAHGSAGIF